MIGSDPVPDRDETRADVGSRRTVTCAWCHNRYQSAVPAHLDVGRQGVHCASDIVLEVARDDDGNPTGERWIVRGGYGSTQYDMMSLAFVANPPTRPADPVCDVCLSERIDAGELISLGPEHLRRTSDFAPRPAWAWDFVHQIGRLLGEAARTRAIVEAARRAHGPDAGHGQACEVCAALEAHRRYLRWNDELDDDGNPLGGDPLDAQEGAREFARHLRDQARSMEKLADAQEEMADLLGRAPCSDVTDRKI